MKYLNKLKFDCELHDAYINTPEQIALDRKIREQENEELMIRWCNKFEELYERRREESARNAEDTGEIDYIALAEKEREEYEEYAKQFEEESEEEIVEEEDEEECDSDY